MKLFHQVRGVKTPRTRHHVLMQVMAFPDPVVSSTNPHHAPGEGPPLSPSQLRACPCTPKAPWLCHQPVGLFPFK